LFRALREARGTALSVWVRFRVCVSCLCGRRFDCRVQEKQLNLRSRLAPDWLERALHPSSSPCPSHSAQHPPPHHLTPSRCLIPATHLRLDRFPIRRLPRIRSIRRFRLQAQACHPPRTILSCHNQRSEGHTSARPRVVCPSRFDCSKATEQDCLGVALLLQMQESNFPAPRCDWRGVDVNRCQIGRTEGRPRQRGAARRPQCHFHCRSPALRTRRYPNTAPVP
jgi:hypothetical protein